MGVLIVEDQESFASALGDVWQHQTLAIDPEHEARGMWRVANPILDRHLAYTPRTREVEMPVYDFTVHNRSRSGVAKKPAQVISPPAGGLVAR